MDDGEEEVNAETLIASVAALAERRAVDGVMTRSAVSGHIDELDLPARVYCAALAAITSSGVRL